MLFCTTVHLKTLKNISSIDRENRQVVEKFDLNIYILHILCKIYQNILCFEQPVPGIFGRDFNHVCVISLGSFYNRS